MDTIERISGWDHSHRETSEVLGVRIIREQVHQQSTGKHETWRFVDFGHGVHVFAMTPDRNVLLVSQYRPPVRAYTLELPGGGAPESLSEPEYMERAQRELQEETGYTGELEFLYRYHPMAGLTSFSIRLYLARSVEPVKVHGTGPEWNEIERVIKRPVDTVIREGKAGAYADGILTTACFFVEQRL